MNKTFEQLADELHNEMAALKQKYPLIHMTKTERRIHRFKIISDNLANSMSAWGVRMAKAMEKAAVATEQFGIEIGRIK